MLRSAIVKRITPGIENAIEELFDRAIAKQKNPGDFILFLENGYLLKEQIRGLSPYVIGQGEEGIADVDRLLFFQLYAGTPFEKSYNQAKKKERREGIYKQSLYVELMIYTHFWEAYPNLKALRQLVNLVTSREYDWRVEIPEFNRHEFIREDIRDVFKKERLLVADVMTQSYNSQLRNAFAHSQFTFWYTNRISLGNYHGLSWERKHFTFDEWDEIFTTTAVFYHALVKKRWEYKQKIGNSKKSFGVWIPHGSGSKLKFLVYDKHYNRFLWEDNFKKERL